MTENRSTIFKFVGVSTERFLDLDVAMRSEKILEEDKFAHKLRGFGEYAIIKSSTWSQHHKTQTVEIEVFEFQRWCKNPEAGPENRVYVFNEKRPTPRSVIETILDTLDRFKP